MEKKFKVDFQLIDDGEHVSSSTTATITDDDRKYNMEEGESDENFIGRKVKNGIESDGFRGVSIVTIREM
jgi:hypothetical protein